jgi:hypothetical protein
LTRITALSITALLVIAGAATSAPPAKPSLGKMPAMVAPAFGNADSISEEELKIHLYFLASDQLEGRNLPSRGFDTAALYVAAHLAEWGLKPGGSTTGTDGPLQPYLMPMELVSKTVIPSESKASIAGATPGGTGGHGGGNRAVELEYGKDWTLSAGGRGTPPMEPFEVSGNLAFAGNGYVINKTKTDPFTGLDVKGKIVVIAGLPAELAARQAAGRGGAGGRGGPNPLGENCTDFLTPAEAAAKNGALAVVAIAGFQELSTLANPGAAFGAAGGLQGAEARTRGGLPRCSHRNSGPWHDQRAFSGREDIRLSDLLWRRLDGKAGRLRVQRGKDTLAQSRREKRTVTWGKCHRDHRRR